MTAGKLCTFRLQGLLFGIAADAVQEVLRAQPITPLPLAPPEVAGLINLRGQIVPALDLRRRLGLPLHHEDAPPSNLVLHGRSGPVSLLIEEIGDVIEIGGQAVEPVPDTVDGRLRRLVSGVCPLADGLLLLLDGEEALSAVEAKGS